MNELVSVIIPTYNRENSIIMSIESVLQQTYKNIEIIVVDDASQDNTENIVNNVKDSRVRYIKCYENGGVSHARNVGIELAKGKYIAFNDSDDIWYSNKLEKQMGMFDTEKVDLVFCQYKIEDESGIVIPNENDVLMKNTNDLYKILLGSNRIGTPTVVVKKEILDKVGGFNIQIETWEDWELFLRIAQKGKIRFINEVLVGVKPSENGVNKASGFKRAKTIFEIIERHWDNITDKMIFNSILMLLFECMKEMSAEEAKKCEDILKKYELSANYRGIYYELEERINTNIINIQMMQKRAEDWEKSAGVLQQRAEDWEKSAGVLQQRAEDWEKSAGVLQQRAEDWEKSAGVLQQQAEDWEKSAGVLQQRAEDWEKSAGVLQQRAEDWEKSAILLKQKVQKLQKELENYKEEMVVISVIVPIYNMDKYLNVCLDSVLKQKVEGLEVICVNDGSTDASLEIIETYARKDSRIRIINKLNSGYGDSVNKGIDLARGKYITILESDDFYEDDALSILMQSALAEDVDVVKGNYNVYEGKSKYYSDNLKWAEYNKRINAQIYPCLYFTAPSIWSAVYKKSFIDYYNIRCLPTEGAAYQDTSFAFKVWTLAQSIILLDKPIINYRVDNIGSSSNSSKQCFKVFSECNEMEKFVIENKRNDLKPILVKVEYISLHWNADRLTTRDKYKFFLKMHSEFKRMYNDGFVKNVYWSEEEWEYINKLIFDFIQFCNDEIDDEVRVENKFDILKKVDIIYLYGAGAFGKKILTMLNKHDIEVNSFITTDISEQINRIQNIEVISPKRVNAEGLIIISTSRKYENAIKRNLDQNHINNYVSCYDFNNELDV